MKKLILFAYILGLPLIGMSEESLNTPNVTSEQPDKKIKPTLKTKLPFKSLCGHELNQLPPNDILVVEFAQKAAIQSFTYDYQEVSDQFSDLEPCFSSQGWKSFTLAIKESGNLDSAELERLFVKAELDGDPKILEHNRTTQVWKVFVPLTIRYENETHYLKQHLKVKLVVGVEESRMAIDQMIATPTKEPHPHEKKADIELFGKDKEALKKEEGIPLE